MLLRLTLFSLFAVLAGCGGGSDKTADGGSTDSAPAYGALTLAQSTYSIAQSASSMMISVNRVNGSGGAVSVAYATADGTALAGADYTATNGTLDWADGDATPKTIALTVSNSATFSGSKSFNVALSDPAGGATVGVTANATVTIHGSSATGASTLSLSAATYSVAQSAKTLTVTIERGSSSSGAASVTYATADGTASAGADYTAANGTLTWADGDSTAKSFPVAISNATPFAGAKTFTIALASATGATIGAPASAIATITGDAVAAGTLALSAATYTVLQSSGSLVVTVDRINGSGGAVTIGYGTANTSAKAGTDYTATSGVLKWAAGDAAPKSFAIPIATTPFAGSKTFAVAIASPGGGATLGTPGNAVVTISGSSTSAPAGAMGQAAAARLLSQATFGATIDSVSAAASQTYDAWFSAQLAATPSFTYASVPNDQTNWTEFWLTNAVKGQDQLRQRVTFALSQIFVISNSSGALTDQNKSMAYYYDMLATNAFGNFRTLLQTVTLNPEMGTYLSMLRNGVANPALGTHADENYAREIMQLFTIGLVQLNLDGSVQTDSSGIALPTYSQTDVENLARVFTGWASNPTTHAYGDQSWLYDIDYFNPMIAYPSYHDTTAKTLINNTVIAAGGTPASDLKTALDLLFNHPNVGPFLGKQLIERLVTSNPSPAYVSRVASVFNNNGQGVRGDLSAVVKAILTDPEAITATGYGKLREPLLRTVHLWRAFTAADSTGMINEYQVVQNSMATYDESPLQSASVFNFYRPDYQYAGPLTSDGLVVPEFQILNENTLVLADMQNISEAYDFVDSQGTQHSGYQGYSGSISSSSVMLHTAAWESLAATPANLVNELNLILMAGQMPTAMQTTLTNYIAAIPANTPWSRVAEAAELVIDSPQYCVQR